MSPAPFQTRWPRRRILTHHRLSKGRKKRPVPEGWATTDDVAALQTVASTTLPVPQPTCVALEGGYAAIAGPEGSGAIYSISAHELERHISVNAPVTDAIWAGSKLMFATAQGSVKVFEGGNEVATISDNAGAVTGLSVHPLGDLAAFVGLDKSIAFYDLNTLKRVSRTYSETGKSIYLQRDVRLRRACADPHFRRTDMLCLPP